MAFAQVEPDAFNKVEFGTVGPQQNEQDIVGRPDSMGDVPSGLIHDHHRVSVVVAG